MKKGLLFISLFVPSMLFSQTQMVNSDFELWDNISANTAEPQEWSSNKTGSGFASLGPQTCFAETGIVHSGTYSVKLTTLSSGFGSNVNGVVTCGRVNAPSTTPSQGYNSTVQSNAAFNMPLTARPDSIVFWVRYAPGSGDSARTHVLLHTAYDQRDPTSNDPNGMTNVIGDATLNYGSTGGAWVRKSVPFIYYNGNTPAYILATFTASKVPGGGSTSTVLYVDDVSLIYNPVVTTGVINPLIYYVSAAQGAPVSVPYTVTGTLGGANVFTAQLSNSVGSFAAPVSLGTLAGTTSGTISGTIPAGTASGTGYRIRTMASSPATTGSTNVSDIQIVLVSNSIAPSGTQTIATGTNGTTLNVTETAGFISREWKYSTVSGGPYSSFGPAQTGTSYIPNFASTGTYYIVCETTYPNGIMVRSNEVLINVVGNSVNPSSTQSILVGVNGTMLTVTETPTGTAREWKYSTTPGGPYLSFGPAQTGTTYIPNFASPGTYYVVCISTISGVACTSNEVVISVGTATLSTGVIAGSPFLFSPNAPDASVTVPYTVSTPLGSGNVFTAQLSDASGSFASPVTIGSVNATGSGSINATILHTTADGAGYRIRVVSSNPVILGSDNGTDLVMDQFDNAASPSATQNIMYGTNGTPVSVTESQSSTRNWKYATTSGGPYSIFTPAETAVSYTPNFALPGTYYVVCVSKNTYNDTVVSNETQINVGNGSIINTSAVGSAVYYVSPNAAVTDNIAFTSDIIFNAGNVFTAEISDASGSFAFPVAIGTLSSTSIAPVPVNIPNSLGNGTGYRIRVNSSNPAATGTDNGSDIQVVQFANSVTQPDTQYVGVGLNGNMLTVSATHPSGVTHEWKYKVGVNFVSFSPAETGTTYIPNFPVTGTYPVACFSVNMWSDTTESNTVMIYVVPGNGLEGDDLGNIQLVWNYDQLVVNLTNSKMQQPKLEILNMEGQVVYTTILNGGSTQVLPLNLRSGMYICTISENGAVYTQKLMKP
jgi:hypothetical protein